MEGEKDRVREKEKEKEKEKERERERERENGGTISTQGPHKHLHACQGITCQYRWSSGISQVSVQKGNSMGH
jgi:hypothetical protein